MRREPNHGAARGLGMNRPGITLGGERRFALVTLMFVAVVGFLRDSEAADIGKVCIEKIPMKNRWDANITGAKEGSTFTVQIDGLPAIHVSTSSSGVFTNLSSTDKHLVKINLDGKLLTSFRFGFDAPGDHLRLWYNPFYGTWSLTPVRRGEKCACPKAERSRQRLRAFHNQRVFTADCADYGNIPFKTCVTSYACLGNVESHAVQFRLRSTGHSEGKHTVDRTDV